MSVSVANPDRVTVDLVVKPLVVEEQYAVVNNPETVDTMVAAGRISPYMEERVKDLLFSSSIPGPALRFMRWTNEQNPGRDLGPAVLVHRTITSTAWRTIEAAEQETIDDGRRPNG